MGLVTTMARIAVGPFVSVLVMQCSSPGDDLSEVITVERCSVLGEDLSRAQPAPLYEVVGQPAWLADHQVVAGADSGDGVDSAKCGNAVLLDPLSDESVACGKNPGARYFGGHGVEIDLVAVELNGIAVPPAHHEAALRSRHAVAENKASD
jgi:hypothetical protein